MIKKIFIGILVLICDRGLGQDKKSLLDSMFTKAFKEKKFNGNVLIADHGNILFEKSYGAANLAKGLPLNSGSVFELASVSKQFTAMGIMLLNKTGKLSYDDSLRKFIPELPYYNISIRNLLNHTSGLPDYMDLFEIKWDGKKIATNKDMISLLAVNKPALLFKPGEKWEYSNTGYALLSSIIEKVSEMSYTEFLRKNIFIPLEMNNTEVYRRRFEKRIIENYAYGYVYASYLKKFVLPDNNIETAGVVYSLDGITGDGTVNSTTGDLLKWDQALYTEKLLNKTDLAEAFRPATLLSGKKTKYGFGWLLDSVAAIGHISFHSGGWPGYITYIERHIDKDKLIVILQNYDLPLPDIKAIRNILYDIKVETPKTVKLAEDTLKQYTGEYQLAPNFVLTISTLNGKIYAQATGQGKFEIFNESADLFFLKVVEAKIKFTRNEKGEVKSLTLLQNGQEMPGTKLK